MLKAVCECGRRGKKKLDSVIVTENRCVFRVLDSQVLVPKLDCQTASLNSVRMPLEYLEYKYSLKKSQIFEKLGAGYGERVGR